MKTCFKCHKKKPLTSFYRHKMMKDGHLNKCIKCTKLDVKRRYYDPEGFKRIQEYERSRRDLPHRKTLRKRVLDERKRQFPGKAKANYVVSNAIRCGKLTRLPCEVCGNPRSEAHHNDYRKPLAVQWLCKIHHERTHHNNGHLHPIQ